MESRTACLEEGTDPPWPHSPSPDSGIREFHQTQGGSPILPGTCLLTGVGGGGAGWGVDGAPALPAAESPTSLQTEGLPEGPHPGLAADDAPYRPWGVGVGCSISGQHLGISQHRAPLGAGICQLRLTVEDFSSSEDRIGGGEMAMGGCGQGPGGGF